MVVGERVWQVVRTSLPHVIGIGGLLSVGYGLGQWHAGLGVAVIGLPFAAFWVWGEALKVKANWRRE